MAGMKVVFGSDEPICLEVMDYVTDSTVCTVMKKQGLGLIGDPHQLLSVGLGNVLPDLLALEVPHIRLSNFHWQADANSALARNVREFRACRSMDDLHFDDSFRFLPITDDTDIRNCVCRDGERANPLTRLRLAYTITIHKSQWPEWDTVVLPISKSFSHMLYRNLLYTAVSRARKRVVIVADPDALTTALQRGLRPAALCW